MIDERSVSDLTMGVGFPERDFDGYALFGALQGHPKYKAIKLIVFLGGLDGYDWGMAHIPADPTFAFWEITLIGESESRRMFRTIDRGEFRTARDYLHVSLPGRVELSGSWPDWAWEMSIPDEQITVALKATASSTYWSPNLVHKGTSWITCAFADFRYEGTLTTGSDVTPFRGIGTFDHPMGIVRANVRSNGVGFWEWDSFMVNDDFGLFAWYAVDGAGGVIVADGVTTFPDGKTHLGRLMLDYKEFEDWRGITVPKAWSCNIEFDHGVLRYDVAAILERPPASRWQAGEALPNPLLSVRGEFKPTQGRPIPIEGHGTGESIQSLLDPKSRAPKRPW